MYYDARQAALNNDDTFHIAAYIPGHRNSPIGINSKHRQSSHYMKRYYNSNMTHHDLHAEADLLLKIRSVPKKICVVRFLANGSPTMAKPCIHCQNFLRLKGVKLVKYTNWLGEWEVLKLV